LLKIVGHCFLAKKVATESELLPPRKIGVRSKPTD